MTELKPPPVSLLDKHLGTDFLPLYTATVRVSGGESRHGRASGVARSDDGIHAYGHVRPQDSGPQ